MNQQNFMRRCIELAQLGAQNVAPNPMVGSVIVHADKIISEGYHKKFGEPHAEIEAINSVTNPELLKKSTLYVNLEPCSHYGKTPPCADAILKAEIPTVVVGCRDSSAEVSGAGIQKLREHGVEVVESILEKECRYLNKRFFTFHEKKRPYIILKWAQTSDGFIALKDYSSKWISSDESRKLVHKWRAVESAILIGTNTAVYDNPTLTVRHVDGPDPLRIVLDRSLRIPQSHALLSDGKPTIVFNESKTATEGSVSYIEISFKENFFKNVLNILFEQKVLSIFVEGGAKLLSSFIKENLWDEARVFTSNKKYVEGIAAPQITGESVGIEQVNSDELRYFINYLQL